jgi:hypothetical protein
MVSYVNVVIVLTVLIGLGMVATAMLNLTNKNQSLAMQANAEQSFEHTQERYDEFELAELEDKCLPPDGYDPDVWKQHISHHPDRYEGCL